MIWVPCYEIPNYWKVKTYKSFGTNTSCYSLIGEKNVRETIVRGIDPGHT